MEGRVLVEKGETGGDRVSHGRGVGDARRGRDGRESDGGEKGVGW